MPTTKIDLNNDPVLNDIVATRSAKIFEEKYGNLLACFDVGQVFSSIASIFRVDGGPAGDDFTVPNLVAATEAAFKKLLTRGALNQFQVVPPPIPPAAQIELDKLFGVDEIDEAAVAQETQASAHQAQVNQAAIDWRSLSSADFKRKWMQTSEGRQIAEECWAKLEADDKAIADVYKTQRQAREREANAAFGSAPLSTRDF
jgi:hypothetical protein